MRRASGAAWRVAKSQSHLSASITTTTTTTTPISFAAPLAWVTRGSRRSALPTTALCVTQAASKRAPYSAKPMHGYDCSRAGTCEYTDVHYPDPVDVTVPRRMQVADAGYFRDFGGVKRFSGPASTIKCYENNPLVREALGEPGEGRVLVVDGGGSMRCALLGDNLTGMAVQNGWSGIIINGCLRDSDIATMKVGVKAIAPHPVKSSKRDPGMRNVVVSFAGVIVKPGDWIYADMDGILVYPEKLTL